MLPRVKNWRSESQFSVPTYNGRSRESAVRTVYRVDYRLSSPYILFGIRGECSKLRWAVSFIRAVVPALISAVYCEVSALPRAAAIAAAQMKATLLLSSF